MQGSRRGFTLVELLVVIGIIAVLISILLPALNRARMQAQITKCSAHLRQISTASIMYANANRGKLPPLRAYQGDTFDFTNAGYISNRDWQNNSEVGSNIGRLVAKGFLGSPAPKDWNSGNAPDSPLYVCPSAIPDPSDNNRYAYMYNFHMKARDSSGALRRLWPSINKFGSGSKGDAAAYNLATGTVSTAGYKSIPRAIVVDPIYGHVSGGKQYATHYTGKMLSFNLGLSDGSVRTVQVKSSTPLPVSADHKAIIAMVQYLEEVDAGTAKGDYDFARYGDIPLIP